METLANSILSTALDLQLSWVSSALTLGIDYIDLSGIEDCYNTANTGGMQYLGTGARGGARILGWQKLNHTIDFKMQRQSSLFNTARRILVKNDGNPSSIVQNGQVWAWSPSSSLVDHYLGVVLFAMMDGFGINAGKMIKEATIQFNASDFREANYQAVQAFINIAQSIFSTTEAKLYRDVRVAEQESKLEYERLSLQKEQARIEKMCKDKQLNVINSSIAGEFGKIVHKAEVDQKEGKIEDEELSNIIIGAENTALEKLEVANKNINGKIQK